MGKIFFLISLIVLLGCKPEVNKSELNNQLNDELIFEKDNKDFQSNRKKVKLYFWDKEKDSFRLTSYCFGWLYKPKNNAGGSNWDIKWKVFTADKSVMLRPEYTTEPYSYINSASPKDIKSRNYKLNVTLTMPNGIGTKLSACDYYIFEYFRDEKQLDNWDIRPVIDTVPIEFWGNRKNDKLYKAQLIIE